MRFFVSLCLFLPLLAHAQEDCPQLSGTFANCVSTLQGSNLTVQQFSITQQGIQYTVVETDLSGKDTTEIYTADGSTSTQTQNDPDYGQIVVTQQTSCANNSVILASSSTVAGQPFFSMQQLVSLNSNDQLVMAISAGTGASDVQSIGSITCSRASAAQ